MQPEIISMGEPMLEFNAEEEGALSEVGRFVVGWGGDTSNFSIAAGRAAALNAIAGIKAQLAL